jgi:hypothetical protein
MGACRLAVGQVGVPEGVQPLSARDTKSSGAIMMKMLFFMVILFCEYVSS